MFLTEQAGEAINLFRVQKKVKVQASSKPLSRRRSSAWINKWPDLYDSPGGHGGRVVTLLPPASEAGVRSR